MSTKRAQPQISFDEFNRLRLLDAEHAKHSEAIAEAAAAFIDRMAAFSGNVEGLVLAYNQQADKLEAEKLRAIGERNAIESEAEVRKRKQQELQFLIAQKQLEIQRAQDHFDSLTAIDKEQKSIIERLSQH